MDFKFSDDEITFRKQVHSFLERELPQDWDGIDDSGAFEGEGLALTRRMSKKLAKRGWLTLAWPKQHGGQERSVIEQMLFKEATAYHQVPGSDMGVGGVSWVGPMLMHHGTDEQKHHLRTIASGDEYWCTLYSEPGSGSDLASLQTRAEVDGDDFVLNGSKIWTSGGHIADWGWLAARTDPSAPKHKGVSMFLLNMRSPGITVRPIINMAGAHHFNEVFFDSVHIPKENLVGSLNQGWYILATALDLERSGVHASANGQRVLDKLAAFLNQRDRSAFVSPASKNRLAEMQIETSIARALAYRVAWLQSQGGQPNQEASLSKLYGSELTQRVASTAIDVLGLLGQAEPHSKWGAFAGKIERNYLSSVSATIAAGTSEVQRNIVATRGLGLPR